MRASNLGLDQFHHEAAALTGARGSLLSGEFSFDGDLYVETLGRGKDLIPDMAPYAAIAEMTNADALKRGGGVVYFPGLTSPAEHPLKQNIVDACRAAAPQMPLAVGWYRGHARSLGGFETISVPGMIEDAATIMDQDNSYALGPVDIHAHSAGALVALYVAAKIAEQEGPERIRRVVCYGIPANYQQGYFQNLLRKPENQESWKKYRCVASPAVASGFYQDQAFADKLTLLAARIVEAKPGFEIVFVGSERDPVGRLDHMKEFTAKLPNARIIECNTSDHGFGNAEVRDVTMNLIGDLAQDQAYMENLRRWIEEDRIRRDPEMQTLRLKVRSSIPGREMPETRMRLMVPYYPAEEGSDWEEKLDYARRYDADNAGKLVVVTGGTRGIGAAVGKVFAKAGYRVAATYHANDEAAQQFSVETGIPVFKFDVADEKECRAGIAEIEAHFGRSVSVLVNNAGITRDGFFHKMTPEKFEAVMKTNFDSVVNMSQAVINGMRERGGTLINMSSVNAEGQVGQTNYAASKGAIEGFSQSLALEGAAKGVRVFVIRPGYTDTEMMRTVPQDFLDKIIGGIPTKRLTMPEEVADLAVFLAGGQEKIASGQTVEINGGQIAVIERHAKPVHLRPDPRAAGRGQPEGMPPPR